MTKRQKRIVFIHYRTGERDGVSLEIEKRAEVLRKLGHDVSYISGYDGLHRPNAYIVPQLDLKTSISLFLLENFFEKTVLDESAMIALYYQIEHKIYNRLNAILEVIQPDFIFVHNMFSLSYNLPATTALINVLDKFQFKTIAVHHDFWFERDKFLKQNYSFIKEILHSLPPSRPYILKHQVINSLGLKNLFSLRRIDAEQIGDYFNFSVQTPGFDEYNQDIKKSLKIDENDIVVLQSTRITERKAIENALYYAKELEKRLHAQCPINVNGKKFDKNNRVIVLLPNFVEVDAVPYYKNLKLLADKLKITAIWASDKFLPERTYVDGVKRYSFWDAYVIADLMTYPSVLEGFGNQLLEAIYFKKLPVVYEYPVFKKDIKPEGYHFVSLGDKVTKKNKLVLVPAGTIKAAVTETIEILSKPALYAKIVENNFSAAKKHHDESILYKDLKQITT